MITRRLFTTSHVCISAMLAVSLMGCNKDDGGKSSAPKGKLGSLGYVVIDAGNLTRTESEISGTGTIAFKDPIGGIDSKKHYSLSFALDEAGSLSLLAHADSKMNSGIETVLKRSADTVEASLALGSESSDSVALEGLDANETITIGVDVHNDESPAHILIWNGSDFSEDAALFNSEEDGDAPGQGGGTFWGLTLNKASITSATIGTPKFVEAE